MSFQVASKSGFEDVKLKEAFTSIENAINKSLLITGVNPGSVAATPTNSGSLAVVELNGVYDATITDPANERGETYFLEYDTVPSFATARLIHLGPSRYWRGALHLGVNSYWRCAKQIIGSNISPWINFGGANPTAVGFGGVAGPVPGAPVGSGSSNQSGRGFGPIGPQK
jgi:hypothetical protein